MVYVCVGTLNVFSPLVQARNWNEFGDGGGLDATYAGLLHVRHATLTIVEVDESLFTKRNNRMFPKRWVVGGIAARRGQRFSAETPMNVIWDRVLPGTMIYGDFWDGSCTADLELTKYGHMGVCTHPRGTE